MHNPYDMRHKVTRRTNNKCQTFYASLLLSGSSVEKAKSIHAKTQKKVQPAVCFSLVFVVGYNRRSRYILSQYLVTDIVCTGGAMLLSLENVTSAVYCLNSIENTSQLS